MTSQAKRYRVGQVVYVIMRREGDVWPMLVVEEVTKKTLKGEEITYNLRYGADPDAITSLSEIVGEVHESAIEAQRVLVERLTKSIEALIVRANENAYKWYGVDIEQRSIPVEDVKKYPSVPAPPIEQPSLVDGEFITGPDGRMIKVKISDPHGHLL